MKALRRIAVGALPFVLIAGVFAAVAARHLAGPDAARDPAGRLEWLLAHEDVPLPPVADNDSVVLQRTGCGHDCPAYELRVAGAGRVVFVGEGNVCRRGAAVSYVRRPQAQRLIAAMSALGFGALPDPSGALLPGQAGAVIVRLHTGGVEHQVRRELAVAHPAPLYGAIEAAIDRVGGSARWLPVAGAPAASACAGPPGRTPVPGAADFQAPARP